MTAKMFPEILDEETLADPKRKAEISVFEALRELTEEFSVFYNCNWFDNTTANGRSDGEADFVIAHPKFGFLVMEVKGGSISRDETTRQWYSKNAEGVHKIKDPIRQARESKHVILDKLKKALGDKLGYIKTGHAVVFPGSGRPKTDRDLGADMPLELFMFMDDMPKLASKVVKLLLSNSGRGERSYAPLGLHGIETLKHLFSNGFDLKPSLSSKIKACEFKILQATEQQNKFLRQIESNHRMLISGGAGTGKTSLALEKVRSLSALGKNVLLLCFNAPLAHHLASVLNADKNTDVFTFHQFCIRAAKQSKLPLPKEGDPDYWERLPYLLLDALDCNTSFRYDAVIVDEGQDFSVEWLECLNSCLKEPKNGTYYIFYDDNQKLYRDDIKSIKSLGGLQFHLFENVRNSRPILFASKAFYSGGSLEPLGPDGSEIEWADSSGDQRDRKLERILNVLISNEGLSLKEIAILTAESYDKYRNFSLGKYKFTSADDRQSDSIVLDSIYRFKGLEREVVILLDLGKALDKEKLLYVGFSRARSHLIVLDNVETIESLKMQVKVSGHD